MVAAGGRETSSMNDRVFLDTNVFVYLYDSDQPDKQARARALVERFGLSGEIVISTQVLQELYASVTRKFSRQLSEEQILLATRNLGKLPVVQVNVGMIFEAISLGRRFQFSFWDSLILQAALDSQCSLLVTEDLQHGQRIGDLMVENPFLLSLNNAPEERCSSGRADVAGRERDGAIQFLKSAQRGCRHGRPGPGPRGAVRTSEALIRRHRVLEDVGESGAAVLSARLGTM